MQLTFRNKIVFLIASIFVVITVSYIYFSHTAASTYFAEDPNVITGTSSTIATSTEQGFHYIEIINGCGPYYTTGTCVNVRSGPGVTYPVIDRLRTGVVLKVSSTTIEAGEHLWYKILFTTELLYPERVKGDLYVAVDPTSIQPLINVGDEFLNASTTPTTKRIVVDISKEMLYAYDGDILFMQEPISTGLDYTPTPEGDFRVFKKTPTRYMQGPIPGVSTQVYDLPGVPWDLYFTSSGDVIHGAYWHDHFGEPWSHGCVNLSPENAKKLYMWAPIGIHVHVQY